MAVTDIATIFLDAELCIKRFTPAISSLLHLVASDTGRPFEDFARKFEDADLLRDARRVLETFVPDEKRVRATSNRWYLRRIQPYHRGANQVGGVVITFVDITQRLAAEASARRLATVLLDSNDAVSVCDVKGRVCAWNRGAERMYGYSEAEALKMNVRDLVPDQLKGAALDIVQRAIRGEVNAPSGGRRVTREGRALEVWLTATPLRDETDETVAVAITERQITEHWQVEEEIRNLNAVLEQRIANRTADLEASEQRIRSVLDFAVDAIVTIDASGRIETFNSAAERTFGYSAQEIIGRNVKVLMPSPDREQHDAYLRRYRETHDPHVIGAARELMARRKDGSEFPIQLSVNEITPLGLYTGTIRDITEQKALQEEIVRIAMLEQRRIGQELHDGTQQELTGLSLLAKSLSEALAAHGATRESELAARLAAGIAETNWHVHALARGLVPVPVDSRGLMAALDALARSVGGAEGPRCRFDCPTPVEIDNDVVAAHLYRIAQEAVTNAVKHSQAGEILVRLEGVSGQVQLSISDNGIGIERRNKQGLGLRTMEHRRALIGAALTVQRKGKRGGTVVTCTVPLRKKVEGSVGTARAPDRRHSARGAARE
jgi:PAS domain S-box-containing protein